jgi:hypothetical protein
MLVRKTPMKRGASKLKRTKLSPVSKRRAKEMRTYSKLRKEFLEAHPVCQAYLKHMGIDETKDAIAILLDENAPASEEIHHREGRGRNYLNTATWVAISREYHERIHANPSWARQEGLLK